MSGRIYSPPLPSPLSSSTLTLLPPLRRVPHNKEVIVISSDGENDQPSISPKKYV